MQSQKEQKRPIETELTKSCLEGACHCLGWRPASDSSPPAASTLVGVTSTHTINLLANTSHLTPHTSHLTTHILTSYLTHWQTYHIPQEICSHYLKITVNPFILYSRTICKSFRFSLYTELHIVMQNSHTGSSSCN